MDYPYLACSEGYVKQPGGVYCLRISSYYFQQVQYYVDDEGLKGV
jgi:hypothetical protein